MNKNTMKAAVLAGPKKIEIREIPVPEMKPGYLEIDVGACGVCGSDIHMWKAGKGWAKQDGPFVMGHEFCGVVSNPGESDFKVGERVTFWANLYCGKCDMCRKGLEHLCRDVNGTNYLGFVCNGAYAEKFAHRAMNAYRLPDSVSDIAAGLIDPLMVAYHAVQKADIKLLDKVLIVGTGIIANMIGELAKMRGASYVAVSKVNDVKVRKMKEIGIFDEYFDGTDPNVANVLKEATRGGFDVAFEVVGLGETLDECIDSVKPGGKVVMIGNSIDPKVAFSMNRAVLQEVQLLGSVSCTRVEFEETIDLIASGKFDPVKYVTDIVSLDDLQRTFERQIDPNDPLMKAVVKM